MTASVLSYGYLRPSAVRESGGSHTLSFETSGGAAPAGKRDIGWCRTGGKDSATAVVRRILTAPAAAAAAILAVADVAAARFNQSASASLDPVGGYVEKQVPLPTRWLRGFA